MFLDVFPCPWAAASLLQLCTRRKPFVVLEVRNGRRKPRSRGVDLRWRTSSPRSSEGRYQCAASDQCRKYTSDTCQQPQPQHSFACLVRQTLSVHKGHGTYAQELACTNMQKAAYTRRALTSLLRLPSPPKKCLLAESERDIESVAGSCSPRARWARAILW